MGLGFVGQTGVLNRLSEQVGGTRNHLGRRLGWKVRQRVPGYERKNYGNRVELRGAGRPVGEGIGWFEE